MATIAITTIQVRLLVAVACQCHPVMYTATHSIDVLIYYNINRFLMI
jgi:hypothetical protein